VKPLPPIKARKSAAKLAQDPSWQIDLWLVRMAFDRMAKYPTWGNYRAARDDLQRLQDHFVSPRSRQTERWLNKWKEEYKAKYGAKLELVKPK
jgi:hypothetical protein